MFRLLELEKGYPLVPLVAFSPYIAATLVVPVLLALALRAWAPAVVAAVVVVVLGSSIAPRLIAEDPPSGRTAVRVMTINLDIGRASATELVDLARRHDVQLVAVQELTEQAAERLDAAGFDRLFPRRRLRVARGSSGSGLYTTRSLRMRPLADHVAAGGRWAFARVLVPGALPLEILSVHATAPRSDRAADRWESELEGLIAPAPRSPIRILAGDFNATLDHRELREVLDTGYRDAAEVAGSGLDPTRVRDEGVPLPVTVDHVLVADAVGVEKADTHDVDGSDHRAVIATLRVPPG